MRDREQKTNRIKCDTKTCNILFPSGEAPDTSLLSLGKYAIYPLPHSQYSTRQFATIVILISTRMSGISHSYVVSMSFSLNETHCLITVSNDLMVPPLYKRYQKRVWLSESVIPILSQSSVYIVHALVYAAVDFQEEIIVDDLGLQLSGVSNRAQPIALVIHTGRRQ